VWAAKKKFKSQEHDKIIFFNPLILIFFLSQSEARNEFFPICKLNENIFDVRKNSYFLLSRL